MDESEAEIIQRTLAEADLEGEQVLAKLVELLVKDHVAARAKAGATAINFPTTLWHVEKLVAERLMKASKAGEPHDSRLGSLAVLLVTCREKAEDKAGPRKPPDDEPPRMRLVRD